MFIFRTKGVCQSGISYSKIEWGWEENGDSWLSWECRCGVQCSGWVCVKNANLWSVFECLSNMLPRLMQCKVEVLRWNMADWPKQDAAHSGSVLHKQWITSSESNAHFSTLRGSKAASDLDTARWITHIQPDLLDSWSPSFHSIVTIKFWQLNCLYNI